MQNYSIGVFDSGYGGLTVLKEFLEYLPEYDFIYLGDNARTPYGTRSFETVYRYTLECVKHLYDMGCRLVILACNTASAKALRMIQQVDLPRIDPSFRVLGVIRPTTEIVGHISRSGHVGVFGTPGTISSGSYVIEINKLFPEVKVFQEACPMWVPLVENDEHDKDGADYFVKQHIGNLLQRSHLLDTIILGCTHYPLLSAKIRKHTPDNITIISQGEVVAKSLVDYLRRHPEIDQRLGKNGIRSYFTSDSTTLFEAMAGTFLCQNIKANVVTFQG